MALTPGRLRLATRPDLTGSEEVKKTIGMLLVAPFGTGLKLAMLVLDVVVFALLYKLLRARFLDARRERVFTRGR